MLKKVLIGVAAIVVVFFVVVALQPSDFRVERSVTINAPADVVFAQVNDFHKWEAWSPWAKMDPSAKNTFEGAPAGVGAMFSWAGNRDVGVGKMTITESQPSTLIRIKLDFMKPMEASHDAEFTFKSEGQQTLVSWVMTGKKSLCSKAFCLFMSMDKMVGGQFEKGLSSIKAIAEVAKK